VKEIVVEYIRMSVETLDKPKKIVETTKRAIKYVFLGMRKRNPFKKEFVEMYIERSKKKY
jgi:hypothetical protein